MTETSNAQAPQRPPVPGPEHQLLDVIVGKWMNTGHTNATEGAPSVKILTSDVYEWAPGGFFVLHYAYGLIGQLSGGGIELISYDAASGQYRTDFFDSQGERSTHALTVRGATWTWAGATRRCTAVFTDNGGTLTADHERLDEGGKWVPAMDVTLTKVM